MNTSRIWASTPGHSSPAARSSGRVSGRMVTLVMPGPASVIPYMVRTSLTPKTSASPANTFSGHGAPAVMHSLSGSLPHRGHAAEYRALLLLQEGEQRLAPGKAVKYQRASHRHGRQGGSNTAQCVEHGRRHVEPILRRQMHLFHMAPGALYELGMCQQNPLGLSAGPRGVNNGYRVKGADLLLPLP